MELAEIAARLGGRAPGIQGVSRQYAVLVPLVEGERGLEVLFEVRADTLSRQPGEICFPGGRVEGDETPRDCALRETWEELSIPRQAVTLLAPLDLLVQPGELLMHPFLGVVSPAGQAALRPSPAEVKEVFTVPLDYLLDHPPLRRDYELIPDVGADFPYDLIGFPQGYPWRRGRVEQPIYRWQGRAIWGLTGRIVLGLTRLLHGPEGRT